MYKYISVDYFMFMVQDLQVVFVTPQWVQQNLKTSQILLQDLLNHFEEVMKTSLTSNVPTGSVILSLFTYHVHSI